MDNNIDINNLPKEKFVLVNENKKLRDKELVTKPIGFFKDAMYRFAKNKGSIVAAVVIGILVLYAIIAPIISPYNVSYNDINYNRVLPKLFNSERIDFLDGAKNVKSNFVTFVEDYAMGLESGHNTIKRQEYKYNEETEQYSYRKDTYQAVGMVYMSSITRADYYAIQNYQDQFNVQVIYPITDVNKRPKENKNKTNANIWYETAKDPNSSNDMPINYSFDADGKLILNNIYKEYTTPILNSTRTIENSIRAVAEAKDTGFVIKYIVKPGATYEGVKVTEDKQIGYLKIVSYATGDAVELVDTNAEASLFNYDATNKVVTTTINGHIDATLDGDYFFGLPAVQGSTAKLYPVSEIGGTDYIPFTLYEGENKIDAVEFNKEYYFAANRTTGSVNDYYLSQFIESKYQIKASGAATVTFVDNGDGTYKISSIADKSKGYVSIVVDGNEHYLKQLGLAAAADATAWTFDTVTHTLKATVTGHSDSSLDKDYYLAIDRINSQAVIVDETALNDDFIALTLVNSDNLDLVTTIDTAAKYRLFANFSNLHNNFYYVDGNFKGDNYFSNMRVEENGQHLYDYAIQKDGDTFEIRVNYYEYYHYYHSQILKDRITEPYHLFGATATGADIFVCLASGARFSFIMAIIVASVNLFVGAIYGAIEGYYGGKIDMVMERIVEILSAVPFMIVITLLKYNMEKTPQVLILFIAFFLTGWIGESGTVRMQFYRFKNQEYVLAARTLGAKDLRIMFKHIFPNALGTIITGCVLVIPGMIFSETSLSYLGIISLDDGHMTSVGTLLSNAQPDMANYPHMMLFPAVFISLLMLSFNLFGNGLRDAFNPSLRGTED